MYLMRVKILWPVKSLKPFALFSLVLRKLLENVFQHKREGDQGYRKLVEKHRLPLRASSLAWCRERKDCERLISRKKERIPD